MNAEKINLIIKNMELLIESLKLEIAEDQKENKYTVRLDDLLSVGQKKDRIDTYEPDYYEEP
jgi:hypothetical protein